MGANILVLLNDQKRFISDSKKLISKVAERFEDSTIRGIIFTTRTVESKEIVEDGELLLDYVDIVKIKEEDIDNVNLYVEYLNNYIYKKDIKFIFNLDDIRMNQYIGRLAGKINAELISNCIDITNKNEVIKEIYYGSKKVDCILSSKVINILSFCRLDFQIDSNEFVKKKKVIQEDEYFAINKSSFEVINENVVGKKVKADISRSKIVVGIGRAFDTEEKVELANEFADIIGASLGATRPVVDNNLVDYSGQVGQTGKVISPDLYIALGISGTPQHIMGIVKSKKIIAINRDEDAEIFKFADYGIIGDVFEVIKYLISNIKSE